MLCLLFLVCFLRQTSSNMDCGADTNSKLKGSLFTLNTVSPLIYVG